MAAKFPAYASSHSPRNCHDRAGVPIRAIRRFARQVAERFRPDKIILFGSHAYGSPTRDSDVDLLVVMPCRNRISQAVKIRLELPAEFAMDLIVRTPIQLASRLRDGDSFMTEIVNRGWVLYENGHEAVGAKGGKRLHRFPIGASKRLRVS